MKTLKRYTLILLFVITLLWLISLIPHTNTPPRDMNNACHIFKQYPRWYADALKAKKKWHVPMNVELAIIREESHFKALALTPHRKLLGIPLPWTHITSATGYTQAIDGTWDLYSKSTKHYFVDRSSFASATDFIGWFAKMARYKAGIPSNDAYDLYLAYHEGVRGYIEHNYDRKLWLKNIAWQVQRHSEIYKHQLQQCHNSLPQLSWYEYW